MRHWCAFLCFALFSICPSAVRCQTSTSLEFLDHAQAAVLGGRTSTSLRFSGTAEWIAGSLHETGTVQAESHADGSTSLQLALATASRTETQTSLNSSRGCSWVDASGTSHAIDGPNCYLAIPWFAPSLYAQPISRLPPSLYIRDGGEVTKDNATRRQISYVSNLGGAGPASAKKAADSNPVHVFYDPVSFLPASLEYRLHPDSDTSSNLEVRVLFSDYRSISGVMVPFHIEKYVQRSLQLKLDLDTCVVD